MNMQSHILAAMREQFDRWQELLASMSKEQINAPLTPSAWTVKIVVAHLRAWQQVSIARLEAAQRNQEPVYPDWCGGLYPDAEEQREQFNATIFETYHHQPWSSVHQVWSDGFQQFLKLAEEIPTRDLNDKEKYHWLNGYALHDVLVGSYEHHQEHVDILLGWLWQQGKIKQAAQVVETYWGMMNSNDFRMVGQMLSDDYVLEFPQSHERIRGRDNFARMNEEYPPGGRWQFTINKIVGNENEVVSDVAVSDGVQNARVISFFTIVDGRIIKMVEFWPDPFDAPENRKHLVERID